MTSDWRGCPARIDLDGSQLKWLAALPLPAHELRAALTCELAAQHAGPHAALGQTSHEDDYWVRWTPQASEIVRLAPCSAWADSDGPATPDDNPCMLFQDHPGPHTFELAR
jgi:hypothetical protein